MSRRPEPETLDEARQVAAIQPKTAAKLLGIGYNQALAGLASGAIPGQRRIGGRILVMTPVFLAWCGVSAESVRNDAESEPATVTPIRRTDARETAQGRS